MAWLLAINIIAVVILLIERIRFGQGVVTQQAYDALMAEKDSWIDVAMDRLQELTDCKHSVKILKQELVDEREAVPAIDMHQANFADMEAEIARLKAELRGIPNIVTMGMPSYGAWWSDREIND